MDKTSKPRGRSGWRTFGMVTWLTFKWILILCFVIGLFAGGAVTGYVASLVKEEPVRPRSTIEAKIGENAITGFVYFNDDTTVGQLRTEEDRRLVKLEEIPQTVIDAVLAIEDNDFNKHIGVSVKGLGRAVKQKLLNEDVQTGGSTLTQQLARRVFLTLDVSDSRKVKEIFLALRLERFLTKDEILTAYLNKVPFGNGSSGYNLYGIKAAAKGVFNINDLDNLNIAQAAYLAGLPQRPSAYTAFTGKGEYNEEGIGYAIERQQLVLRRMLETGRITQAEYDEAMTFDVRASLAKPQKKAYNTFPYLMLEAERKAAEILLMQENPALTPADLRKPENAQQLEDKKEELLRGGYHIYTTIDKRIYNKMREIGSNPDNFSPTSETKGIEQIAAMLIDHKTGAIISMLEGRDFYEEQMNYATQMTRQPGSTMKTIAAYVPAIDEGLVQPGSIVDDAPIVLKDGQKGFHIPKNSGGNSSHGGYNGLVTAREALNRSLNNPALKLFIEKVTIPRAWEFVRKLGITTLQPADEHAQTGVIGGLSLGTTVEELTNAYGAIANNGTFNDAYMIRKITDATGKVVYEHRPKPLRVFSEQTAFLVTDMLRTVITNGTASTVRREYEAKDIPIAGKTGSTQSYGDVWFMGYTPDLTLGVWAGHEKPVHVMTGDARQRAQKIWTTIMNTVTSDYPELFPTKEFAKPEGIVKATVSGVSGKRPTELTKEFGKLVTDWFNEQYVPKDDDDAIVKMATVQYNGINYIAQPETPADFVKEQTLIKREKPLDVLFAEIEAAQEAYPSAERRPISYYKPKDAGKDAPSMTDPRIDDGKEPSAPSNLAVTDIEGTNTVRITFQGSPEADVVGYRLYRSLNGGPYTKYGESIYHSDTMRFIYSVSDSYRYSFYITAVDVAGRESAPSVAAAYGAGQPLDPLAGLGDLGQPTDPLAGSEPDANPNEDEGGDASPTAPQSLSIERTDLGVAMSWSPNSISEMIERYNVYYSEDGTSFQLIGSVNVTRFEYITPLPTGSFRVTAVNSSGESLPSVTVSAAQ